MGIKMNAFIHGDKWQCKHSLSRQTSHTSSRYTAWYLHEMRGVRCPVRSVLGSHVHSLFSQLPSERVLEATQDKHHPLHDLVDWDLLCTLGFSFLLFGFRFRSGQALSLLVSRLLCWGSLNERFFFGWNSDKFCGWRNNLNAKIQTQHWVLPLAVVGLGLCLGVASLPSGEPAGLIFFEGGDPEADCRSLLNSNFLFAGGYEETSNVSYQ